MEEDLSMYGNQLVTSTSISTVGYVIWQIPCNFLLTRVSPRWVIPTVCFLLDLNLALDNCWLVIVARSGLGTCDYVYVLCEILQSTLRSSVPRWYFRVSSVQCLYLCPHANLFTRSGFYPGIHYMLGSWYSPQEIGKRAMIFWLAGSIGSLFSGFLQAAAYTNLSAVGGFAGWRWLFIIE